MTGSRSPVFQCKLSTHKKALDFSVVLFIKHFKKTWSAIVLFTVFIVFRRGQDLSGVPGYPLANSLQSVRSLALPDCRLTTEQLTALFRNGDLKPSLGILELLTVHWLIHNYSIRHFSPYRKPFYFQTSRFWPRVPPVYCTHPRFLRLMNTQKRALRAPPPPITTSLILHCSSLIFRENPFKKSNWRTNPRKCGTALLLSYSSRYCALVLLAQV